MHMRPCTTLKRPGLQRPGQKTQAVALPIAVDRFVLASIDSTTQVHLAQVGSSVLAAGQKTAGYGLESSTPIADVAIPCTRTAAARMLETVHLELQPVMTPYGTRGPSGGGLQGVRSTPIPAEPPKLLPKMIHALAEVHLHSNNNTDDNSC